MRPVNVYLVRHGETEENKLGIVQGQLNTQLNKTGRDQAQVLAQALKDVPFSHGFTSDLSRAADTARIVLQYHPSVELRETPALRERHLGSRQGKRSGTKYSRDDTRTKEPRDSYHARLRGWWENSIVPLYFSSPSATATLPINQFSLASRAQPLTVLVVSHSASIATLVLAILIDEAQYTSLVATDARRLYNTSITEVQFRVRKDDTGEEAVLPVISRFGDINHLLRPEVSSKKKPVVQQANADLEESAKTGNADGKKS